MSLQKVCLCLNVVAVCLSMKTEQGVERSLYYFIKLKKMVKEQIDDLPIQAYGYKALKKSITPGVLCPCLPVDNILLQAKLTMNVVEWLKENLFIFYSILFEVFSI